MYMPKGLLWEDWHLEQEYHTARRTVTEADVVLFAGLSGDYNPLHTDEVFMQGTPFGRRIAHGALVLAIATGLANQAGFFEGTTVAFLEQTTRWPAPTLPGDTLRLVLKPLEKKETSKPDRGLLVVSVQAVNQKDTVVLDSEWKLLIKRRS